MPLGEALQERRQHVAARCRRGRQRERAALGAIERAQFLVHPGERVQHAQAVDSHHLAGLRQLTRAAVAFDELLADGRFERLQVLAGRRLPHPADVGSGGDRALPPDLD